MKKNILLIAILAVCVSASFAQKVGLEFNIGVIGSRIKEKESPPGEKIFEGDVQTRYGMLANLMVVIPAGERFSLRTGLGYASRGGKFEARSFDPIFGGTETYSLKIEYIELPFLLSVGSEYAHFFLGPQLSVIHKSDVKGFKANEVGLKYGAGVDIERFLIRIQFYNGLSDMVNSPDYKIKNNNVSVSVGWKLFSERLKLKEDDEIPHRILD